MSHKLFRVLPLIFLFISCKEDKEEKVVPLRFEKESIVKKAGKNCDTAEYECTVIELDVVRAKGGEEISKEINKALEEHVIRLISSEPHPGVTDLYGLSENFLADYREAAESFSQEPPWEAYVNQSIYHKSPNLLSIGITTEMFSGGAHGYKTLTFFEF